MELHHESDGSLTAFAWPGGYEVHYVTADGGTLCWQCANGKNGSGASTNPDADSQWRLIGSDVHWEGDPLTCDHCARSIVPEYGDD